MWACLAGLAWGQQSLPAGLFWMFEETLEEKAGFPEQRRVQGQMQGESKAVLVLCKAHQASLCSKGLHYHMIFTAHRRGPVKPLSIPRTEVVSCPQH